MVMPYFLVTRRFVMLSRGYTLAAVATPDCRGDSTRHGAYGRSKFVRQVIEVLEMFGWNDKDMPGILLPPVGCYECNCKVVAADNIF